VTNLLIVQYTAEKTSTCPTPNEREYTVDEIYASAQAEPTLRLKDFALMVGRRDCLRDQLSNSISDNLVARLQKLRGGDAVIQKLLGFRSDEIVQRDEFHEDTQAAHIIPYRLANYNHKVSWASTVKKNV
jgi:hypothetical protein